MDKLTAIKIKYDDGVYSDEIPIGVVAENVQWDDTHTLVDIINSISSFVTPEMYGAVGDGVADDTVALQAAIDSDMPVHLKNKYAISDTIHINKDKFVLCGEKCIITTLNRLTYAIRVGDNPVTGDDAALWGLIQVFWYGGTLTCDGINYFENGFTFERCFNSYFFGISITNCIGTGFRWGGTYGANTIVDNCVVRGTSGGYYGNYGFLVGRNDQRVYNCSAIDMMTGFFADRGYVRFKGCFCWLTRTHEGDIATDDISNVVGYDIYGTDCAVIDSTCDTLPTGIKLHPTAKNFYANGLSWWGSDAIVPARVDITLIAGSEENVVSSGFITGIQTVNWNRDVRILKNISGLQIIGLVGSDFNHIIDYLTAVTQLMPNCTETDGTYVLCADVVNNVPTYYWNKQEENSNLVDSAIVDTAIAG